MTIYKVVWTTPFVPTYALSKPEEVKKEKFFQSIDAAEAFLNSLKAASALIELRNNIGATIMKVEIE